MASEQQRKVALVTGGAKRVGRAIVERLAHSDYDVVFTYHRSGDAARAVCEELAGSGARVTALEANLADPFSAAWNTWDRLGHDRLDVLVNNASLYVPSSLDHIQQDMGLASKLMTVNYEAPLMFTEKFRGMLRLSRGHIINMVDLLGERPWPQYLAYCASKAALANLTLALARELAPEVTVNGIAPGVVEWPEDYPEAERAKYLKRVPLGRAGTPRDVADMVLYLCTAGSYLTGQILRLDGGRSIT